ncbi:hypothetical protein KY284_020310 [Solanum tuberosum]|nr:hypothetical protein KY284_020310 [Solanum tuberosum]
MNSTIPPTNEQYEEQGHPTQNTRGRTQMHNIHSQRECKLITLNRLNQPVGPTDEVVTESSSFLGILARVATLCPFDIFDWRNMDTKKDLWDYTKEKYIIPEAAKGWTLVTIREAWRWHRTKLKINYYDLYDNDEIGMAKKPGHVLECQFRELLKYWKSEKFKKISETNTKNRKKLMNPHTASKKSFALIRNKLEKEEETISAKEIFVVTRRRKHGRLYKTSNENTKSKIAEMEEIETQMDTNDQSVDAFSAIIGPENAGRLGLYGVGVTKTTLKRKVGNSEQSLNDTNDVVQQMQERIEKMEKQMEEQKKYMRQEVITDVISQLQHAGLIDHNILATLSVPSPKETCTSEQAADQGDEIEQGDESSTEHLT